MLYLVLGLVLFLGTHSVRIVADDWRTRSRARLGAWRWRALYTLLSLLGFGLIVWGFGLARQSPSLLWSPPPALRHLAMLLTLLSFVLLAAAYVPGNRIKARIHHPMTAAVKLWALAHLLSNGTLAHVLLFGTFLLWSIFAFLAARQRDMRDTAPYSQGSTGATGVTVALGVALWIAFTLWLHGLLIGVRPFG
ncbi:MAG: protein NrnU [Comamonadaceae bacterium CG_4_9_14_3_um_filter_60_33]|nr:MAG: protein NrnU [Comamonadaceae bacterium CG2_30_59_20]PIY29771.1 MAG: protein NrnU [Comamonadaceae bacterium CG_4_10_14_3_um_filter_60_42]PJB44949.1 MAG: protein NrnU [Comamonadaceae bacterium CG_4_9_14_3_um_filter_60_33]